MWTDGADAGARSGTVVEHLKVAVCLYPLETVVFAVCVTDVTAMTSKLQYV